MIFLFREGVLLVQTKEKHEIVHLYVNDFLMPFEMKEACGEDEIFKLNEDHLNKAVDEFLSLS